MIRIKTEDIAIGSAMPYQGSMIDWLQFGVIQDNDAVIAAICNGQTVAGYILSGAVKTGTTSVSITAGNVNYGGFNYATPAATLTLSGSQVVVGTITKSYPLVGTFDPVTFSDGTTHNVHEAATIVWSAGASGSADVNYDDFVILNVPVTTQGTYCQYSKKMNRVTIQGLIGAGYEGVTSSSGSTSWTLPESCRPSANRSCYLIYFDTIGGQIVVAGQGILTVDINGKVTFSAFTGAGTARFTQLYFTFDI